MHVIDAHYVNEMTLKADVVGNGRTLVKQKMMYICYETPRLNMSTTCVIFNDLVN